RCPRWPAILVSENERPPAFGAAPQMDVLAPGHRLQPDLRHPALPGAVRYAAPCLYLSRSSKLGLDEHGLDQRRLLHERSCTYSSLEFSYFIFPRQSRGRSPLGRMDRRMRD